MIRIEGRSIRCVDIISMQLIVYCYINASQVSKAVNEIVATDSNAEFPERADHESFVKHFASSRILSSMVGDLASQALCKYCFIRCDSKLFSDPSLCIYPLLTM